MPLSNVTASSGIPSGRKSQGRNGRLLEHAITELDTKDGAVFYVPLGVYFMFDAMSNEPLIALIAEITAAFDGVSRENGITLHQAIAIDDWKTPEEQLAARRFDIDQDWQDVPNDAIVACESALSFLDAKGFRYYLPAFMVCGLRKWDTDAGRIVDTCEYHLLHESQKSLRQSEPSSIAAKCGFTDAQCRAIAHFLRFVVGDDDELTTQPATTLQAVAKWENFVGARVPST